MEFMKLLKNNVIKLVGNKDVKEIVKFVATNVIQFACNKFNVNRYKYDENDLKTMIYNHNLNNNNKIKYNDINMVVDLLNIKRFIDELSYKQSISTVEIINELSNMCSNDLIIKEYNKLQNDDNVLLFDRDTLETSAIADNYEISSGGIYVPNRNIEVITAEAVELADAKNDYLEERIKLGDDPDIRELRRLLNKYHDRIHYDEMRQSI